MTSSPHGQTLLDELDQKILETETMVNSEKRFYIDKYMQCCHCGHKIQKIQIYHWLTRDKGLCCMCAEDNFKEYLAVE